MHVAQNSVDAAFFYAYSKQSMEQHNDNLPRHIAIIPDGNRRWARMHGKEPSEGHEAGAANLEKLIRKAHEMRIYALSFWGASMENIVRRPLEERRALVRIYEQYFTRLAESKEIHDNRVRINIIGHWEEKFPQSLRRVLERCVEQTKNYTQHLLTFFMAYSGDDEMVLAIRKMVEKYETAKDVTKEVIKQHLMTKDLPPVDLLIRTGGEPHLSAGFMMWDVANAQLFFSEKYFPDFGPEALAEAIADYQRRERRLGK